MRVNYLSNKVLQEQIIKSKWSYCWFLDDPSKHFTHVVDTLDDARDLPLDSIVRHHTYKHVPHDDTVKNRRGDGKGRATVNFRPFSHYRVTPDGLVEVARSHWRGDLLDGRFSAEHGRITDRLGSSLMLLSERFASKGNLRGYSFRDEIEADVLCQLVYAALKFDETKGDNPFAFYSTVCANAANKRLTTEKRMRDIADDLRIEAGLSPSSTRQTELELAKFEPTKLLGKRGRPKSVTVAARQS